MERLGLKKSQVNMLVGLLIAFFAIPFLPKQLVELTDNILVRVLLLAGLLSVAYVSPVVAIAAFLVLAMLFVERNKIRMQTLKRAMQQSSMESPAIASIVTPDTAPPQPPFENPEVTTFPFMPQVDSGDDSFKPVAKTINEKQPLPTEGSNDGSEKAIQQLFEWVNPNLAQQP